jgi:hypothetical protein
MVQWKFKHFLQILSKFKLVKFKIDENFTQSIFKLVKFKYGNTTNYTLKHEI